MNQLFNIEGKVVILTGGYGILGRCMSKYLSAEGAVSIIIGRNIKKGKELVQEIEADGGKADFFASDVMNREELETIREAIVEKYKKIDVLINLAGGNQSGATIPPDKTCFDLDVSAFRQVVDLNLFGTVIPTMVFAKAMVNQGKGNIINISSESSLRPLTRVVGYGCAKAAINNFTEYMAGELALKFGEQFRVNALAPGFFLTDQNRALMSKPDGTPTDRCNTIVAHTPFQRLGQPEELLGTLHWLISDASKFVTGTVIPIDGGFNAFSI